MIEQAGPDEADAVQAVTLRAYEQYLPLLSRRPLPMDDHFPTRVAAGQAWVLRRDGRIAGLVILEDHEDHLYLDNIAVDPDFLGLGLGRVLLDFVESEAVRRGFDEIRLTTNAKMLRNQAIYAQRGYVETGRQGDATWQRVSMAKKLG